MYIDVKKGQLLYIDPMSPRNENAVAQQIGNKWLEWAQYHNVLCTDSLVPVRLTAVTKKHAVQRDGRNCGIFTMCVSINSPANLNFVTTQTNNN